MTVEKVEKANDLLNQISVLEAHIEAAAKFFSTAEDPSYLLLKMHYGGISFQFDFTLLSPIKLSEVYFKTCDEKLKDLKAQFENL